MKSKKKNNEKLVSEICQKLFELIGVNAKISVKTTKTDASGTEEEALMVQIEAPNEAGLLIGSHGATLSAIESFLAMAVRSQEGEWVRIMVDIGDWKAKQEEHLVGLAKQAAQRAKTTGETQHLYNLSPSQRRIIHLNLSEDKEVETQSVGEGSERYLVVKPKA